MASWRPIWLALRGVGAAALPGGFVGLPARCAGVNELPRRNGAYLRLHWRRMRSRAQRSGSVFLVRILRIKGLITLPLTWLPRLFLYWSKVLRGYRTLLSGGR